jgi:ribosomal protein L37AE/L43A
MGKEHGKGTEEAHLKSADRCIECFRELKPVAESKTTKCFSCPGCGFHFVKGKEMTLWVCSGIKCPVCEEMITTGPPKALVTWWPTGGGEQPVDA